jgi:ABC-type sugar transport system substrate-binding protein
LTGLEHFGRVTEATPSHIGDVEETVETVEVDVANALADAQAKVEQAIQANPDIDAIYASFDTIGQGAAAAVDAAGGSQFVVSFNGDSTALDEPPT